MSGRRGRWGYRALGRCSTYGNGQEGGGYIPLGTDRFNMLREQWRSTLQRAEATWKKVISYSNLRQPGYLGRVS